MNEKDKELLKAYNEVIKDRIKDEILSWYDDWDEVKKLINEIKYEIWKEFN